MRRATENRFHPGAKDGIARTLPTARAPPRHTPYFKIANRAYSEQVGVNRHAGGNNGDIQRL